MKRIVQETCKRTTKSSSSFKKEEKLCLPRLDIQKWYEDPDGFASELRYACHNVGFFSLCHDIPSSVTKQVMKEVGTFFESTPLETKMKMSYEHSPSFRGYMKLGVENTSGQIDHREQIELASETTPPYNTTTTTTTTPYERLRGKNQWPAVVVKEDDPSNHPNLQMIVEEYIQHMLRLCQDIIQALSYTLTNNNDKHAFDSLFYHSSTNTTNNLVHDPFWQCKLASYNYNTIHPTTQQQQQQGVGEHTDSGFLTLILQNDNNSSGGGLQVLYKDEWMDVTTGGDLDVLICNLGEIAQLSTGGYLRATPHRVMMNHPSSSSRSNTRTSIPFFYNPKLNCVVNQSIIPSPEQQKYDRMKNHTGVILPHYGDNAFKSLARSHPNVFQKHHPDLKILENGQVVYK